MSPALLLASNVSPGGVAPSKDTTATHNTEPSDTTVTNSAQETSPKASIMCDVSAKVSKDTTFTEMEAPKAPVDLASQSSPALPLQDADASLESPQTLLQSTLEERVSDNHTSSPVQDSDGSPQNASITGRIPPIDDEPASFDPSIISNLHLSPTHLQTSAEILSVLHRYQLIRPGRPAAASSDLSSFKFLSQIYTNVRNNRPILLCLPAFPFKSPNSRTKVLGKLPDMAENVALAHLDGMCKAVGDVYKPGAELTIISDGLVYNDLLGVPDKDVWAYGQELRSLAAKQGRQNIRFSRLRDLVHLQGLVKQQEVDLDDEMMYVANASNFRRALLNAFARPDWDWDEVKRSEDVCLTYRGYIKFLETDLAEVYPVGDGRSKSRYKKGVEYIARQMLMRGDAFATAVRHKYPHHIRLSIHHSADALSKLPVSPLPVVGSVYTTPWHCSIAYTVSGEILSGLRSTFESDPRYELVTDPETGRPSHFREKSSLWNWAEDKGGVTVQVMYPAGYMVTPAKGARKLSLEDIDAQKVRALAELNSPVVLRGFVTRPDQEAFIAKAYQMGKPTGWKFGLVLEVKDRGADARGLNNVLSAEWMPFHYDGIFKLEKTVNADGTEAMMSAPPRFQFFLGATPSPRDTGFTLFTPSSRLVPLLPPSASLEYLESLSFSCRSTIDSARLSKMPLIVPHPITSKPCLRYHEPWPQSKTKFDPTEVEIDGVSAEQSKRICDAVTAALKDRRCCYWHVWEKGDVVVSDNIGAMHTRSDFTGGSERELWRIHFD